VSQQKGGRRTPTLVLRLSLFEVRVDRGLIELPDQHGVMRHPPAEIGRKDHVRSARPRRVPKTT